MTGERTGLPGRAASALHAYLVVVIAGCGGSQPGEPVRVTIPPGTPVAAVAESLTARGIIGSPKTFSLYARLTGQDRSIQAGVYDLRTGMSVRAAVRALVAGSPALERLSVPEGLMLTELATLVEDQLDIPRDRFLEAARDPSLVERVGARGSTLEGYLYPSTYMVRVDADASDVVVEMVREFEARWRTEWDSRLEELGMSRDEIITLASIVEGEARHHADRPYVSSVYHNRLARGMRLQADPTVIYALGRRRRLFERDYLIVSPYNTYRIDGLPPHPIGQPSTASIEAALFPRQTNFLYFVAGPDGKHVFSRSFREHLAAIERIRGGARRRSGSRG